MINLYLVNNESLAANYGIGNYLDQIVNGLLRKNIQITIIEFKDKYAGDKEGVDQFIKPKFPMNMLTETYCDGIRKIILPKKENSSNVSLKQYYRNIFYVIIPYVNENEKNIFHFNYLHDSLLISLIKGKWPKSIIILTIHYLTWAFKLRGNTSYFCHILKMKDNMRNHQESEIYKSFLREVELFFKVDKIICLSNYTRELLISEYKISENKIKLMYNRIKDEAIFLSRKKRNEKKRSLFLNEKEKIILYVGRLDVTKGLIHLIKAFNNILQNYSNIRLLIVGSGNYDIFLKECSSFISKVTFTGRLEKDKLYDLYQIADVGVLPSFNEQCSYAVIEMMMHGMPIVGTSSTGLNEMIENDINGYKIDLKVKEKKVDLSIDELGNIILKLVLADSLKIKKMRKNSRILFEEKYNLCGMQDLLYIDDIGKVK